MMALECRGLEPLLNPDALAFRVADGIVAIATPREQEARQGVLNRRRMRAE